MSKYFKLIGDIPKTDTNAISVYEYLEYRRRSNCIDWDEQCEMDAKDLATKYPIVK